MASSETCIDNINDVYTCLLQCLVTLHVLILLQAPRNRLEDMCNNQYMAPGLKCLIFSLSKCRWSKSGWPYTVWTVPVHALITLTKSQECSSSLFKRDFRGRSLIITRGAATNNWSGMGQESMAPPISEGVRNLRPPPYWKGSGIY